MTPVSSQRHETFLEIGEELRSRAGASIVRRKRQQVAAFACTAVLAVVLSLGIALPRGTGNGTDVAVADVLAKASATARQDLALDPDDKLYRGSRVYFHYYESRGEHYDYWTSKAVEHWIAADDSALMRVGKTAGPTFDTEQEYARFVADGSPKDRIKLGEASEYRLEPGSFSGAYENVGKSLRDYTGDPEILRRVLGAYEMSQARLIELSANQDEFNQFVRSHVRDVLALLRGLPPAELSDEAVDHATTSLVIGLFVNWGATMPPQLRPALLSLLAATGGSGLEFDPDFEDEQGRQWVALSVEADGQNDASGGKAHETLLFDPETFEQRGSRLYSWDGKIGFTEIVRYGVTDQEGEVPDGLPEL